MPRFLRPLILSLALCAAPALAQGPSTAPPAGGFSVLKASGEVFHVLDGQPPRPVTPGSALTGGRLVVMEDAAADLIFPNQKSFHVPAGTVVYLDPAAQDVENACAGSMAIRDRTVLFVAPGEKQQVAVGKPIEVLLGIDPAAAVVQHVGRFALVASRDDDEGSPVETKLEVFDALPARASGQSPTSPYRLYRFTTDAGLPAAGTYELFVKTVEEPTGKKIGKSISVGAR